MSPEGLESGFALLEGLPGAVLLLDREGVVRFVNDAAEVCVGEAREALLGRNLFREALPGLHEAGLEERYRETLARHPSAIASEARIGTPEGERPVRVAIGTSRVEEEVWGVVLIEDRSALHLERERRRHAERLAAVGELAAGVAHEVNNPLASIKGFAQLLARDTIDRGQQQALEIISHECSRIARIIDNLLGFARQQERETVGPLDLNVLTEEVLALKRYSLETAGVALHTDLDPELPPIEGERGSLQHLLVILLSRAERALLRRPGERRLRVRTGESNEGIVLHLEDNGPGMPRERLRRLLESDEHGEPRLGLSAAHRIAADNQAALAVESGEERGTLCTLRFPRHEGLAGEPAESAVLTADLPRSGPLRVLVADDEPTLRLALAMFLGRQGYEVDQAENADDAFRMAQSASYDVALVDVRMPGDGLSLVDRLSQDPGWAGRIVIMTGDQTVARVREEIADGRPCLAKPFDMMDAVRLIERLTAEPSPAGEGSAEWTSS